EAEDAGVAAHLVERGEAWVAVEGAVLDALGHHHAAGLLEAQRRRVLWVAEHRGQLVERLGEVRPATARLGEGEVEVLAAFGEVGAVDREAGEDLGDGVDEGLATGG